MATCGSCGATVRDDARFCARCGAPIGKICATCGNPLEPDARFCPSCGAAVESLEDDAGDGERRERKLVTILFADVTGSTALGERLDPERLREVLDTFFAAMREEIEAEGGTVEKFIGDAVMAAFGVPSAHEDDPARAIRAASRMLARLELVNERLRSSHDVTLQIRIGINTGDVLASTEPATGEAMVVGDAVNAAARLESIAEPGTVLAGERTVRSARGFRFRDVGERDLRGKTQAVKAFELIGERPLLPERGVPGLQAPMVGRDTELALLQRVFERVVAESRPHLVTIYGDAGVGKSRLTQELLTWASGEMPVPRVVRGRCLPYGDGVTYWPLAEILKSAAGALDTDPAELVLEKVQKIGRDLLTLEVASDPVRATAALAYTVGLEDPEVSFSEMDPKEVRATVHAAWRSFFSAMAAADPSIVVIEDIHWADPAMLDLLEELADRSVGPLLFVCPSRPELTGKRPGWGGGRRNVSSVALDPLGHAEAERLVHELLAIDDLPDRVRDRILERGEGNPFFIEEILRHLIDEGHVVHRDARWQAARSIADIEIPDTVQGVLAARIDLLEPKAKRVLQAAAVVGRVFWPEPVRLLATLSADDVDEAMAVLQDRDLVLSKLGSSLAGQPEFIFKHVLTRDVAYESLPRRDRATAHAAVAGWLEETAGERAREFGELLAYHYATAARTLRDSTDADPPEVERLRRRAFECLLQAAADARRRLVLKKAERLADDALDLSSGDEERAQAFEALAQGYMDAYDGDASWRCFTEAATIRTNITPAPDERVALLWARACEMPLRWPGSMRSLPSEEEVETAFERALSYLPEGDSEVRVRVFSARSFWPFAFPGREFTEEELTSYEQAGLDAYDVAMRLELWNLASAALDGTAGVGASIGNYSRAQPHLARRMELLSVLTDQLEIGDVLATNAWNRFELGDYPGAERLATEGIERTEGRSQSTLLHALAWRVVARFRLGDWDGALSDFDRILEIQGDRRDEPPYFAAHGYAGAMLIDQARGGSAEVERLAGRLDPLGSSVEGRFTRLLPWMTLLYIARGDLPRARARLNAPGIGWRVHGGDVYEARLELAAAERDWSGVPALLSEARAFSEAGGLAMPALFADRLEGHMHLENGRAEEAVALLEKAADGFASRSAPWERARTQRVLAEALRSLGRTDDSSRIASAALEEFERLGASGEAAATRDLAGRA